MKKLSAINNIVLPLEHITSVYEHLRYMGKHGAEGVAVWAGIFSSDQEFVIQKTIIPKQKSFISNSGLHYLVDGDEMFRLGELLHASGLSLIAQIHSHPGEAYHSETDDAYPIVTKAGAISIVVPDFASAPFTIENWAVYMLSKSGEWKKLPKEKIRNLINIKHGDSEFF